MEKIEVLKVYGLSQFEGDVEAKEISEKINEAISLFVNEKKPQTYRVVNVTTEFYSRSNSSTNRFFVFIAWQ